MSKSFGSWPGVIFSAPVPNSGLTYSSAMILSRRPTIGRIATSPTRRVYRSSCGCTAIAVSASIVSGRTVATVTEPWPDSSG
jgi:hypothetical protein